MNIFPYVFRDKEFWQPLPHRFECDWRGKDEIRACSDSGTFQLSAGELQTHFPLACAALLRSTAGFQPFAQTQTVMTEAINVVMRVWHPKCYSLQGLSHISENMRSGQKSAFSFLIPKQLDFENFVLRGILGKQKWRGALKSPQMKTEQWKFQWRGKVKIIIVNVFLNYWLPQISSQFKRKLHLFVRCRDGNTKWFHPLVYSQKYA